MVAGTFVLDDATRSRYLRTSWLLVAQKPTRINDNISILPISEDQAQTIAETIRKKNVFARHSWERHFYVERALQLADRTVIEIFAPGDPKAVASSAAIEATLVERLLVLASTFSVERRDLQRKLALSIKPRNEIEFVIGPRFHFIRSRKHGATRAKPGLPVNDKLIRDFKALGLVELLNKMHSEINTRVQTCFGWLYQSRTEVDLPAAVVKTAIACETLLVFSESESLAQTLSERIAFIVGRTASERQLFSRVIKRFYEVRSGVVHGSRRKRKHLSYELLEIADRLVFVAALTMHDPHNSWSTPEDVRLWCEDQRWAKNIFDQKSPISKRQLDRLVTDISVVMAGE